MRHASLLCLTAALLPSCAIVSNRHEVRSNVELVDGGSATGTITAGDTNNVSLLLTNESTSTVTFHIKDDLGRELEQGAIRRGSHAFAWRPMGRKLLVEVAASGAARTSLGYELSSFGPIQIQWDLSRAQQPAQP